MVPEESQSEFMRVRWEEAVCRVCKIVLSTDHRRRVERITGEKAFIARHAILAGIANSVPAP